MASPRHPGPNCWDRSTPGGLQLRLLWKPSFNSQGDLFQLDSRVFFMMALQWLYHGIYINDIHIYMYSMLYGRLYIYMTYNRLSIVFRMVGGFSNVINHNPSLGGHHQSTCSGGAPFRWWQLPHFLHGYIWNYLKHNFMHYTWNTLW